MTSVVHSGIQTFHLRGFPGIPRSVGDMLYFHTYKRSGFVLDIAGDIRGINDMAVGQSLYAFSPDAYMANDACFSIV